MNLHRRATALAALAAAAVTTAGLFAAITPASADERPPGNPGMARMHELMRDGNPGIARMHELMMAGSGRHAGRSN